MSFCLFWDYAIIFNVVFCLHLMPINRLYEKARLSNTPPLWEERAYLGKPTWRINLFLCSFCVLLWLLSFNLSFCLEEQETVWLAEGSHLDISAWHCSEQSCWKCSITGVDHETFQLYGLINGFLTARIIYAKLPTFHRCFSFCVWPSVELVGPELLHHICKTIWALWLERM